jgi:hypothetical protein
MQYLRGHWFGQVYPATEPRPLPPTTARGHALHRLRDFLALCVFSRKGDVGGPPIAFTLARDSIFTEQPDDPVRLNFPAIGMLPGVGTHDTLKLGPCDFVEGSHDRYAPGTALLDQGLYVETFTIECWSNHPAEREAVLAGVEAVLRTSQRSSALALTLPGYYGQIATFSLEQSQHVDDPSVVQGRRRGQVMVRLDVEEVLLVNVATLEPYVVVGAVDAGGSLLTGIDPLG